MVKPNSTLTSEMLEALENYPCFHCSTSISDLVSFTRSPLNNQLDEKAQNQIENVTMEVLEILKK